MTTSPSDRPEKNTVWIGVGIFILTLVLYLITSYPTVAYIDSGELAIVNWSLGIAHPTGYPLYTLLGHLFSLLPLKLIATQNLFGSVCTAFAVVLLFLTVAGIAERRPITMASTAIASLIFGISPLIWSQGVTNEVYGLHLLFISLMLWFLSRPFSSRRLVMYSLVLGLSFGNHLSTILTVPAFLVYVFLNRSAVKRVPRAIWLSVAVIALSATIYLYLPIRSSLDPLMDWGEPTNWASFYRHVSGWQYRVWMFDRGFSEIARQLGAFAVTIFEQFPISFWPFVLVGFWYGFRRFRPLAGYALLILLFDILYALNFSIPDIDNYLIPSVVVVFLFAGFAVVGLSKERGLVLWISVVLLATSLPLGLVTNWQRQDQSGNYAAADGVENFFKSCEPQSLILCANWDYISPWLYLHFYEKDREDVLIIDSELVRRSWYFDFIRHADSSLYDYIKPEVDRFMPQVKLFEAGLPYDENSIQESYQAILIKIMEYPQKKIYLDVSVQLTFKLPGDIRKSGRLFRLVREGEEFTPPEGPFQPLRFGKPQKYLTARELWHLNLSHRLDSYRE
jgi:hypothetical protein